MPIAKIKYEKNLTATLKDFPVNVEMVIPKNEFKNGFIRKTASTLKKQGYLFKVVHKGIEDTLVTRLK